MGKSRTTARFGGWIILAAAMLAAVTVTAYALTRGNGHAPPKRPLAVAIHNALKSKPVSGVSARFTVTQHLIPGTSKLLATSPIMGASGRVWASGHRVKLDIRSALGRVVLAFDGKTLTLYDPKSHSAYRLPIPHHASQQADTAKHESSGGVPSIADITKAIKEAGKAVSFSGAMPGVIAGQGAYTVKISAKHDSGLIGPLAIAWDAANGTPLQVALYSRHSSTPAIAFTVTHINYGKLPERDMLLRMPHGTKVTTVHLPSQSELHQAVSHLKKRAHKQLQASSTATVRLPATLAGMPRAVVHAAGFGSVAVYGKGLGSIVVIAHRTTGDQAGMASNAGSMLPTKISVNGAAGHELATTLGTFLTFTRGGVSYTVLASQPASTVLAAARALP